MGYTQETYKEATRILRERREKAERTAELHRAEVKAKCPQLAVIEQEMANTGLRAIHTVGAGKSAKETIESLAKYNLELQEQRKQLLLDNGYPENYLHPAYTCPICEDKGVDENGNACACYQKLLKETAYALLAKQTPLRLCGFDDFTLSQYPNTPDANGNIPREEMEGILSFCKGYAKDFTPHSGSLFLYGKTGLGKTHLSLAIAAEVIKLGYGVIYGSAQNLLSKLEKERFGKAKDEDTESLLLDCDLLILDDLGTEFTTAFTVAEIYNIVNTRDLQKKPTIINTNLNFKEFTDKYSDRVTSRILGSYTVLHFLGNDMRIQLREE